MKLKRTIQVVEYSNTILIIGLLLGGIILASRAKEGKIVLFEMLIVIPFILTFFLRKVIIAHYLKKKPYPGVFYSVMEKIGLTQHLDIPLPDDLLDEIYKPGYPTAQFLSDNNLKTEIGAKRANIPLYIMLIVVGVAGVYYYMQKYKVQNKSVLILLLVSIIVITVYLWIKQSLLKKNTDHLVSFTDTHLILPDFQLNWKDIYDWSLQSGNRNQPSEVIINYYDADRNINEAAIDISKLDTDRIDFLLLMTHFKGKFGQQVQG